MDAFSWQPARTQGWLGFLTSMRASTTMSLQANRPSLVSDSWMSRRTPLHRWAEIVIAFASCLSLNQIEHWRKIRDNPRLWFRDFLHNKWIEQSGWLSHEAEALINFFCALGMVGQLNGDALGEVEILVSRLQSVVETYSCPTKPLREDAKVWSYQRYLDDCCDPAFKSYAVWKNRREAKLAQA